METKPRFRARNGNIEIIGGLPLNIPLIYVEDAEPLSVSGHAEVYQGTYADKGKVSIKLWKNYTAEAFERTRNELAALAAIQDLRSFVYKVYHFDALEDPEERENRIPYIIAEYVDGVPANKWVENKDHRTRSAIWQLIRAGISRLHIEGVTHGDPHLANMIVLQGSTDTDIAIRLIDFGSSLKWPKESNFDAREFFIRRECKEILRGVFFELFPQIDKNALAIQTNPQALFIACEELLQRA